MYGTHTHTRIATSNIFVSSLRIAARPANVPRKVYDSRARTVGLEICWSHKKEKSLTQGQQTRQVFVHTDCTHSVFLSRAAGAHDHDHNSHGHNAAFFPLYYAPAFGSVTAAHAPIYRTPSTLACVKQSLPRPWPWPSRMPIAARATYSRDAEGCRSTVRMCWVCIFYS